MTEYIHTIDFGQVPIRKKHTDGTFLQDIEISGNCKEAFAEIRKDDRTSQPFAVLFNRDWKQIK